MIRKYIQVKKKSLREESKPVHKSPIKNSELIEDMEDTLAAQKDPEGVGLQLLKSEKYSAVSYEL